MRNFKILVFTDKKFTNFIIVEFEFCFKSDDLEDVFIIGTVGTFPTYNFIDVVWYPVFCCCCFTFDGNNDYPNISYSRIFITASCKFNHREYIVRILLIIYFFQFFFVFFFLF